MKIVFLVIMFGLVACNETDPDKTSTSIHQSNDATKRDLLSLERKWLDAEFALDTAYISTLIDPSFIDISETIHNKQQALKGMYNGMDERRKDSLVLDSLKFDAVVVNLYSNTAVFALITHEIL